MTMFVLIILQCFGNGNLMFYVLKVTAFVITESLCNLNSNTIINKAHIFQSLLEIFLSFFHFLLPLFVILININQQNYTKDTFDEFFFMN